MWFNEIVAAANGHIGRIDATGTNPKITDNPLPATNGNLAPDGLAVGSDDALWFAALGDQVGSLTTGGTGAVYGTTANSRPKNIVQGADGAMWFTESGSAGNQIARIRPNGIITGSGVIGSGSVYLNGITLGSDGNVWFTETSAGIIGKITTDMIATQFVLPSGSLPEQITSGPDGALYFTDQGKNAIVRIPTSATPSNLGISTYTGLTGSYPLGITTGPDGSLWFTECGDPAAGTHQGHSVIGRLDASTHDITEYSIPSSNVRPYGITSGPDGAVWFTEASGGVSRLAIGSSAAVRHHDALLDRLKRLPHPHV
jgi:virginiamycin B lyase